MNNEELSTIVDKLSENFDSVLVLVSTHEDGATIMKCRRRGNLLTARGHAQNWLDCEKGEELAQVIADKTKEE